MQQCKGCTKQFEPVNDFQLFHNTPCRSKYHAQRYRTIKLSDLLEVIEYLPEDLKDLAKTKLKIAA